MTLRKPSDLFNKKETSGVFNSSEVSTEITETYDRFRDNFDKINILSDKVEQLSQQLSEKLDRTDLENAMLSQLMVLDENFKSLQNQVKGLNKEDLREFRTTVSSLTEIVEELIEDELPKFKKQFAKNQINIGEKFDEFKEVVEENISSIKEDVDITVHNIAEVIDNNLEYFNNQLQETSDEVKRTTNTYNKLSKIVESRVSKENEKLEEYSQVIKSLYEAFVELETSLQEETSKHLQVIEEKFETISLDVSDRINNINEKVGIIKDKVSSDILNIKADVVINEQHLKKFGENIQEYDTRLEDVDKYLQENHKELVALREEVFTEIEQIPVGNLQENLERLEKKIDYIRETYSRIEPEVIVKEVITETLLNEPPETKNSDPLTPLNQNFVTLDQLQEHYRLFINRIQQQLSTLGGGGETRFEFLDDVDRSSAKVDGRFLKYNATTGKWVGASGGGGSQTLDDTLGLGNTSSLGMSVGVITATYFVGDGSLLTNIPGSSNSGYANTAGIATYASTAGVSTYSSIAGIATYASSSGIATYSRTSGISTYASTAGIATYAQTAGIATSAGTATTATYLSDAANILTGTINKDRIATTNALTVLGDLYVSNNISFGGTVTQLNTEQLNIVDADIVLGIGTSFSPSDNTANHGGIAIASTEGSPLVDLNIVPGETNPSTYKKIMWFKGDTIGAGLTDAWLFNYAVGIGSTQVPNGVRLAVGNIRLTDNTVTATTFSGSLSGNATSSTYASTAGVATYSTTSGVSTYASTAGIATVAQGLTGTPNITVGIVTAISYNGSGSALTGIITSLVAGTNVTITQSAGIATISATGGGGGGSQTLDQTLALGNTSTLGMSVGVITTTTLNVTGIATIGTGIVTTLRGTNINYTGVSTFTSTFVTNLNVSGVATIGTGIVTTLRGTTLNYTGVSTFSSGPVLISSTGTATTTGTASQPLQVTGGAYVSGSVGVGTTNPREKLEVVGGNIGIQGVGSTSRFYIQHNTAQNSLDFVFI